MPFTSFVKLWDDDQGQSAEKGKVIFKYRNILDPDFNMNQMVPMSSLLYLEQISIVNQESFVLPFLKLGSFAEIEAYTRLTNTNADFFIL